MFWPARLLATGLIAVWLATAAMPAAAHEFWIEPEEFRLSAKAPISAQVKIGDNFKGDILAYIPAGAAEAGIADGGGKRPLQGFAGDIPFFSSQPSAAGAQVLYLHALSSRITYETFEKFEAFLRSKGLDRIAGRHRRRNLPDSGFVEAYIRCAKALVTVGSSSGGDQVIGMPLELIAETNPYSLEPSAPQFVTVRLLWRGKPLADAQIEIFRKGAEVKTVRTGEDGRAQVSVAGAGAVLLNAVHMVEGFEEPSDVWHSYWASLTFDVGGPDG